MGPSTSPLETPSSFLLCVKIEYMSTLRRRKSDDDGLNYHITNEFEQVK